MLRAIIIDDEANSRTMLKQLIYKYCPNLQVVAMAKDVLSGIEAVRLYQPNIVFLDIEMPKFSGFKFFEFLEKIDFEVILMAAYEQYALRAIKTPVTDYLLKPISSQDLIIAVQKASENHFLHQSTSQMLIIQSTLTETNQLVKKIIFPTVEGLIFLTPQEIICIEAAEKYTCVYTKDGNKITSTKSLKDCEASLQNIGFCKIHRSSIINMSHINKFMKGKTSSVIMSNRQHLTISNGYKAAFLEALQG